MTSGTYKSHLQRVFSSLLGYQNPTLFAMLPSTLKYLYSIEPVRMHFPAKQPCTNDTVCNAACSIAYSISSKKDINDQSILEFQLSKSQKLGRNRNGG